MKAKKKVLTIFIMALLVIWTICQLFPLYYMFNSSFKTGQQLMYDPWGLPNPATVQNYSEAWMGKAGDIHMNTYFANSIIITVVTLVLLVIVSLMCGYAISRLAFKGRKFIHRLLICLIAVPTHALLIPVFLLIKDFSLLNNPLGAILVFTAFNIPFSVVIMASYFEQIPYEVEEAALIDGCNKWRVFWHIGIPMSKNTIATVAIVNLTSVWSEYMFASILLSQTSARTLPVAVSMFNTSMYNSSVGTLMAGLSLASIPILVVYFIFQKQIVKGMSVGAIK